MKKLLASLALVIAATLGLAGCAAAAPVSVTAGTVVVDVRTADEYAQGHLSGALNIDVQTPEFDNQAGRLPLDGTYLVYCHSGSRAAVAVSRMKALGFTHVNSIGGITDASTSTGLEIVTTH